MIKGDNILLRAVEPQDLVQLLHWENSPDYFKYSEVHIPYSQALMEEYIERASADFYTAKQLRLIISENRGGKTIGHLDLFDFDPKHARAGVSILLNAEFRGKGFAKEALILMKAYASEQWLMHQLYCQIRSWNKESIALFESVGFVQIGILKDWAKTREGFEDECVYQCIL